MLMTLGTTPKEWEERLMGKEYLNEPFPVSRVICFVATLETISLWDRSYLVAVFSSPTRVIITATLYYQLLYSSCRRTRICNSCHLYP